MQGIRVLEIGEEGLRKITLPKLTRPLVKSNEDKTEELAQWGVALYCYSVIAHVRTILSALLELGKSANIPAAEILSRHVFEWTAHTCYMSHNLTELFQRKYWAGVEDILSKAVTGNYWAKQYGVKYTLPNVSIPTGVANSIRVTDLIGAYEKHQIDQLGSSDAKDTYSLLCEFSHPNSACLQHYHFYNGADVTFGTPAAEVSTLPVVNWCMIDLLLFLQMLLALGHEKVVLPLVVSLLKQIAALAPSKA